MDIQVFHFFSLTRNCKGDYSYNARDLDGLLKESEGYCDLDYQLETQTNY